MPTKTDPKPPPCRLWWWVIVVFVLQLGAWTAWFVIAGQHRVAEVPLVTTPR